ncbi:MAG TPA: hypothetical protein QF517_00040 [Pseudomonadales bacterium]|jgi:hypothetical protein|nr:hypothetical protein [Gammaproteobacteria bacterium]MDP6026150.1 hypothetical protein [Pseudomonadales bacterium]MDP7451233.1 hypothetical protein [Arenicellales bacterium]MDP6314985.1 hypothetical protein [Pseudomonadales bacterium]MDP7314863.1 hypothetical protein [Pseudomonadales bacterium]|tara:strand:- start:345 stop:851 length:507 start_codon:yes stop_codon:yes gene_type:complete
MTIQDLIDQLGNYGFYIAFYFVLPPLFGWSLGFVTYNREGRIMFFDYVYSVLIYLVCIPGVISAVLIGYSLFFVRQNLLEVNFLIYFVPIISMALSFFLIGRRVSFNRLPGFGRLSGLMMMIGLSFLVVLALFKLRLIIGFFGSLESLVVIGIVVFLMFKYASSKLFK